MVRGICSFEDEAKTVLDQNAPQLPVKDSMINTVTQSGGGDCQIIIKLKDDEKRSTWAKVMARARKQYATTLKGKNLYTMSMLAWWSKEKRKKERG